MAEIFHTGEKAGKGRFVCTNCGVAVSITDGDKLPPCPKCDQTNFKLKKKEGGMKFPFKRKDKKAEQPEETEQKDQSNNENSIKKENENMTTLEQVRKAYEDLSEDDKKTFHQSLADRVHESIAAQEEAEGDKDSQSAADREHEALGAEHADWKRFDSFEERLKKLEEAAEARRENKKLDEESTEDGDDKEALEKARKTYGLGSKFIAGGDKNHDGKISPKEASDLVKSLKM